MRARETLVALLVCGSLLGCLPSSFDDLTEPGHDAPICDAASCLDAAADASTDAGDATMADAGDGAAPGEPDASMPDPCATPECDPQGPAQTRMVGCPDCGERKQSRSCSADTCTWGAWTDTTECTWCDACAEIVYCDAPEAMFPNRGTWCRQLACSPEQALGECEESVMEICGAKIEPFVIDYL